MKRRDAAVLGMGIGGLSTAALLARRGWRVTLYDRMTTPGPVGSGFVLQPTGLEVLEAMGLADAVAARGAPIRRMLGKAHPSGRTVLDVGYAGGRHGLAVQRTALFGILHAAATEAGVAFELGRTVVGVEGDHACRPVVDTMSHMPAYDLVVDAMGCRSPNHEGVHEIGYGALWASVPWSAATTFDDATLEQRYQRASRMAGVLPVGSAHEGAPAMATVFWSVRNDAPTEAWRDEAARMWPDMEPLLAHAKPVHARYRHHTRRALASRRAIRIGDAWHATSPQLGQGANMALIDALSLDAALARTNDVDRALRDHVSRRRTHVRLYQSLSRILTPFYQSDGRLLPMVRDHVVAPMLSRRGLTHAVISALVAGGVGDPIGRIGWSAPGTR